MSVGNWINAFFINYSVKRARGFRPNKKIYGGLTVYQASMSALAMMLVKHARDKGVIDQNRMVVLERVHGHFSLHVMFTKSPTEITIGIMSDMNHDFDNRFGPGQFSREYESSATKVDRMLPEVVRKEMIAHLAMFQRVDNFQYSEEERRATIRDAHALLFGKVSNEDISEIQTEAATYTIDRR